MIPPDEKLVPLKAIRSLLPKQFAKIDIATIYRWISPTKNGKPSLEYVRLGNHRFTSAQAVRRYMDAVTSWHLARSANRRGIKPKGAPIAPAASRRDQARRNRADKSTLRRAAI